MFEPRTEEEMINNINEENRRINQQINDIMREIVQNRRINQQNNIDDIPCGVPVVKGDLELTYHERTFVDAECYVLDETHTFDIPETGATVEPIQTGKKVVEVVCTRIGRPI